MNYFGKHETSCRCGCGFDIKPELLSLINKIRVTVGSPVNLSSGARCLKHNRKQDSEDTSSHVKGLAVDIKYYNSKQKFILLRSIFECGVLRIGDNPRLSFIHIDIDTDKTSPVFFKY